jgi:hypothetical protein
VVAEKFDRLTESLGERKMEKFRIVEEYKRTVRGIFYGMAIPCDKRTADGSTIRSEKVLKFNRSALRKIGKSKVEKVDPRMVGGEDRMRFPVGKPGSPERVVALAEQYASLSEDEMSPFTGDE